MKVKEPYLDFAHRRADVTDVNSCGSVHGAPPRCSAACNYGHKNCTYRASLQLEKTLGRGGGCCFPNIVHYHERIMIKLEFVQPA